MSVSAIFETVEILPGPVESRALCTSARAACPMLHAHNLWALSPLHANNRAKLPRCVQARIAQIYADPDGEAVKVGYQQE